jgi:CRP-like cAMP-binding protein
MNNTQTATLGPGDGFGEIALLKNTPRTATITTTLISLDRNSFLSALTHPESHLQATQIATNRLAC